MSIEDRFDHTFAMRSPEEEDTEIGNRLIANIDDAYVKILAISVPPSSFEDMANLGKLIENVDGHIQALLYVMDTSSTVRSPLPDNVQNVQTRIREILSGLCDTLSQHLSKEVEKLTVEQSDEEGAAFEDKLVIFHRQIGMLNRMYVQTGKTEGIPHIAALTSTHNHIRDCAWYQRYLKQLAFINNNTPDYFSFPTPTITNEETFDEISQIQFKVAVVLDDLTHADKVLIRQDLHSMHPLFGFNTITLRREVLRKMADVQNTILTHILQQIQDEQAKERGAGVLLNQLAIHDQTCPETEILMEARDVLSRILPLYGTPSEDIQAPYKTLETIDFAIRSMREYLNSAQKSRPGNLH